MGMAVFHPMGYDSFGLPAENAAIRTGVPPAEGTAANIARIREQLKTLGFAIDWDTEIATSDPEYYRWTQWLFLRMYERGLAERREAAVNWCPHDQTVLANEQVIDGRCERCGHEVELRQLTQWFLRITDYAQRLLDDMDELVDWPERVLTMQRNWIGRSEGARVTFAARGRRASRSRCSRRAPTRCSARRSSSSRPSTPRSGAWSRAGPRRPAVREYAAAAARASAADRGDADRPKTGVFTGRHVVNPVTGDPIPVWVADYVLMDYGTGAIMAVPGHDERDFAFAQAHGLPITRVIAPEGEDADAPLEEAYAGPGRLVNSGFLDGLTVDEAKTSVAEWLAERGLGELTVGYRLRDWLISRQRYWGAPIPVVHCPVDGVVPVPDDQLPVLLPARGRLRPEGPEPDRVGRRVREHHMPQVWGTGASRDGHDGHVRRLVLVLPPLHRAAPDVGPVRARGRRLLAAGRPVHRRDRARDPAPALRALLREGAARRRPASAPASRSPASSRRG